MTSPAMMTDRYELSMLQSFIAEGIVDKKATFEVFTRRLQPGFRYGVFAGLGRLLPMIEEFRFKAHELVWLREQGVINDDTLKWLTKFRFTGTIEAYREGDLYFPNSPVLTVTGTLGEGILLETLILSVLNHDSAIASKAARMVSAANGRPIIEMGSRRTHEESAMAAARAAYIAGFSATSNLAAGMTHGIPTTGTAAHAFTLAHESEECAFRSQVNSRGAGTSLLVDTYEIEQGITNAVIVTQQETGAKGPGAIRIDSGDLAAEAHKARKQLDALGATDTKVIVTGDLDEHIMKDLAQAPIDGYGVGTKLVSVAPAGFVYKLVEVETELTAPMARAAGRESYMRPVSKKAKDKVSVGGRKRAWREYEDGRIVAEKFSTSTIVTMPEGSQQVQTPVMINGWATSAGKDGIKNARWWHEHAFGTLPDSEQVVWSGEFGPYIEAVSQNSEKEG